MAKTNLAKVPKFEPVTTNNLTHDGAWAAGMSTEAGKPVDAHFQNETNVARASDVKPDTRI